MFAIASIASAGTFEIVARMGDELPDGNGEYGVFSLGVTDFNNAGQILVHAEELVNTNLGGDDLGANDDSALILFTGSAARIISRENDGAGGAGGKIRSFNKPMLNDNGDAAFSAALRDTPGGTADNVAIFRTNGNAVGEVVRKGDTTPLGGTFASLFANSFRSFFNDAGELAFSARIDGGSSSAGIFTGSGSTGLQTVAYDGMSIGSHGTLNFIQPPQFGDGNYVAFLAFLQGSSATKGIFRGRGDNVVQITPTPMAIADPASTQTNAISDICCFNINGNGDVVFGATLINTVGGADTNQGLFIGRKGSNGGPSLITQKGDRVPGGDGKFDGSFLGKVNDSRQVLFRSSLRETSAGTDWEGLFFRDSNFLIDEIVRLGDTLPGSGDTVSELGDFQLANTGDVVFEVVLDDGDFNPTQAVFWWDGDNITPILRAGDTFDGSTISETVFNPIKWQLNDAEQLALTVRLSDGRSVLSRFSRGTTGLPGDYNGDGSVDAADYIAWRKGFGTTYDESHYTAWRSNFGATSSSTAAGHFTTVPEPSPLLLALLSAAAGLLRRADIRMSRSWIRENSADC